MKREKAQAKQRFDRMKGSELAEAAAPYGREMAVDAFGPMGPAQRKRWERARRKPGRPRRGKGAKVISVSVERELLSRSDRLAKELGISRASLIERGLKAVLLVDRSGQLANSSNASEQKRLKEELARMTYDD